MRKSDYIREINDVANDLKKITRRVSDLGKLIGCSSLNDGDEMPLVMRVIFDGFLAVVCEDDQRGSAGSSALWHEFRHFEKIMGTDPVFTSQKDFGRHIGRRYVRFKKCGVTYYRGIIIRPVETRRALTLDELRREILTPDLPVTPMLGRM